MRFDNAWWWIDALCINQTNIPERNSQVLRMANIYRKASSVRVWLGAGSVYSRLAVELVQDFTKNWPGGEPTVHPDWRDHARRWARSSISDEVNQRCWRALIWAFRRGYWNRVWIIQEVISNSRTLVHLGMNMAVAKWFFFIADALMGINFTSLNSHARLLVNEATPHVLNNHLLVASNQYAYNQPPYELYRLLVCFRGHSCSDPRDKVYGLAALARTYEADTLAVNYELSMSEVNKEAARFVIVSSGRLETICTPEKVICQCESQIDAPPLPSWIPDWSCNCFQASWKSSRNGINERTAGFTSASASSSAKADISSDGYTLSCRGLRLGTIVKVHNRHSHSRNLKVQEVTFMLARIMEFVYAACASLDLHPEINESVMEDALIDAYWAMLYSSLKSPDDNFARYPTQDEFLKHCRDIAGNRGFCGKDMDLAKLAYLVELHETALFTCTVPGVMMYPIFGTSPPISKENDVIVVLYGCDWPVLLRPVPNAGGEETYAVISEAFVQGFMHGRLWRTRSLLRRVLRFIDHMYSTHSSSGLSRWHILLSTQGYLESRAETLDGLGGKSPGVCENLQEKITEFECGTSFCQIYDDSCEFIKIDIAIIVMKAQLGN